MATALLPETQRRLASINAAADYAGVSSKTIRRRISDGTIRGFKLGSRTIRVDHGLAIGARIGA
jgi:excisionase family DNA binding protein